MDKVLCLIETFHDDGQGLNDSIWDQDNWLEKRYLQPPTTFEKMMPLIDHPHTDVENGQKESHYHADARYFDMTRADQYLQDMRPSLPLKSNQRLEYKMLNKIKYIRTLCYTYCSYKE